MNTAIVLAAGKGSRMNTGINKQYINILGKPIIAHTLDVFNKCDEIQNIILVAAEDEKDLCANIIAEYKYNKVRAVVAGGRERQESVYNGLTQLDSNCKIVLIHDGARPLVKSSTISVGVEACKKHGAVSVGVPSKDTIKIVTEQQIVNYTPNRKNIWITQTPQIFKAEIIKRAHKTARENAVNATDDALLVEYMGYNVKMIEADYENIKITTPEDLIIAEIILSKRQKAVDL